MEDFVTWVLLRVDSFLANAKCNRTGTEEAQQVPKRNSERVLPFGALDPRDSESPATPQSAA
jgi:hypothetical protein